MHLSEVIALRAVPAAGLIVELTRRCPLSCAHCSTSSTMAGADPSADAVLQLVDTFSPDDRPEVVALTGGEPLLRPRLVREIASRAHGAGARVHVLTGMFFARGRRVPVAVRRALSEVDHVAASLDRFHEREVPRAAVFRVFEDLMAEGQDVSLQIVGLDSSDPYVAQLVADVRSAFGDRVPLLVSGLRPEGRARDWLPASSPEPPQSQPGPSPCTMAAWPVVCADGRVSACCNQAAVDGTGPAHLQLGHAMTDGWPAIGARCREDAVLRAIRTVGPPHLAALLGAQGCDGYCGTCHRLAAEPDLRNAVTNAVRPALLALMDGCVAEAQRSAGAERFAERFGMPRYAELVSLGLDGVEPCRSG